MASIDDAVFDLVAQDNSSALSLSSIFDSISESHLDLDYTGSETSATRSNRRCDFEGAIDLSSVFDNTFQSDLDFEDVNAGLFLWESDASAAWSHGTKASKTGYAKDPLRQRSLTDDMLATRRCTASQRTRKNKKPMFWTKEEHGQFLELLEVYNGGSKVGLGFGVAEQIAAALGNRSVLQIRSHAQKHFAGLRKDESCH